MNITYLAPYYVTIYFQCNKTRPIWTNTTHTGDCRDRTWLASCIDNCQIDAHAKCMTDFEQEMSCATFAASKCFIPVANNTNSTFSNSSSDITIVVLQGYNVTSHNITGNYSSFSNYSYIETGGEDNSYNCYNDTLAECLAPQNHLCQSLATTICTEGPEYDRCLNPAKERYRVATRDSCLKTNNDTCLEEQWMSCYEPMKANCEDDASAACNEIDQSEPAYQSCYDAEYAPCYQPGRALCQHKAQVYCANLTYTHCYVDKMYHHNVTVEECATVQMENCTTCLHENFVNCTQDVEICSDIAVKVWVSF